MSVHTYVVHLQEVPDCLIEMADRYAAHKEKMAAEGGDRRGGGRGGYGGGRGGGGFGGGGFGGGGGGGRRRRDDMCGIRLSTGIA